MITSQELYENGFISSETVDNKESIRYVEFTKFINRFEIQVTNEIEDGIVMIQYVEIGFELGYQKLGNIESIEKINQLTELLK
jgi:hypothetical protein